MVEIRKYGPALKLRVWKMDLAVKLNVFEGPLDLLLHLIEKNKLDIYDIPIAQITDQYLEHIAVMDMQDLDLASEFLVMAATLLDLKSAMLLPADEEKAEETQDMREELTRRLLEYKMFKEISRTLRQQQQSAGLVFYREEDLPEEVARYRPPVNLDALLEGISLLRLNDIFQAVMKRQEDKIDPVRSKFGRIEKEPVKVEDKITFILAQCRERRTFSFASLFSAPDTGRFEIVVTFLAVLELMKVGAVRLVQEELFGNILIQAVRTDDVLERLELEFR